VFKIKPTLSATHKKWEIREPRKNCGDKTGQVSQLLERPFDFAQGKLLRITGYGASDDIC